MLCLLRLKSNLLTNFLLLKCISWYLFEVELELIFLKSCASKAFEAQVWYVIMLLCGNFSMHFMKFVCASFTFSSWISALSYVSWKWLFQSSDHNDQILDIVIQIICMSIHVISQLFLGQLVAFWLILWWMSSSPLQVANYWISQFEDEHSFGPFN